MRSIDVIAAEHGLVGALLECLRALVQEARLRGRLDARAAHALLHLFEEFVDWSHQDKEELHLFPAMRARATPAEEERLARLFEEHAEERRRLVGMHLHLAGACRGRDASLERFTGNALLYLRLQRTHLAEENLYVLPLAEMLLTPEDDQRILRGFRRIDARFGAPRDLERRVAAMCGRFGVDRAGSARARPRAR